MCVAAHLPQSNAPDMFFETEKAPDILITLSSKCLVTATEMGSERETQPFVHSDVTGQLWQIFLNKVRLLDGCTLKPQLNC